ncbi:unnamed protein product, partial [Ectocarpus sp. 12 AP-2014]
RVVVWDVGEKLAVKTFVNTDQENWRHLKWLDKSTVAALSIGGRVCTLSYDPETAAAKPTEKSSGNSATEDAGEEAADRQA